VKIDFENLTRSAFAFLSDGGFRIVESDIGRVRFESERVYVEVLFDAQRSFEVGVQIGLVDALGPGKERPFSLPEILRLRRIPEAGRLDGAQATTANVLCDLLTALARNTRDHARDFLAGDANSYRELASFRELETGKYAQEQRLRYMRADADAAWASKNYPAVVKAYSSDPSLLTAAERKRLEYAQKHIAQS
jgi:hypothetical protein